MRFNTLLSVSLLAFSVQAFTEPAMLQNAAPYTWIQLPDTRLESIIEPKAYKEPIRAIIGPRGMIDAWNGAVWIEAEQRLEIIAAGGHGDYCGNEYSSFDLDDLRWNKVRGPSDMEGYDYTTGRTPDGLPASRHTYQQQVYAPSTNRTYIFGGSLCSGAGVGDNRWWSVTPEGEYEYLGEKKVGYAALGGHALFDPVTGHIFIVKRGHVYQYDIARNTMEDLTRREADYKWGTSAAIDVERRIILAFGHGFAWVFDIDKGQKRKIRPEGDLALLPQIGIGLEYVASLDRYLAWSGGNTLYSIHPTTFEITPVATSGLAPKANANGVYGRFRYSGKYDAILVVSRFEEDVYFMKLGKLP